MRNSFDWNWCVQENSTEVPPSPASVCSSSCDEICRPYYPSPVSPLEALFDEDFPSLPHYEELDSNRQGEDSFSCLFIPIALAFP